MLLLVRGLGTILQQKSGREKFVVYSEISKKV